MTEDLIVFSSGDIELEGRVCWVPGTQAVVITHPHPLYGGDMDNSVVEVIARVYRQAGYATLRFNFRGVGSSQGEFDQGQGEQQDVQAALAYLANNNRTRLALAGYSFGAWVNALAVSNTVDAMLLVSPPVALLDFRTVTSIPRLSLVVTGDRDLFAPPDHIEQLLPRWNVKAKLVTVKGADHFYQGRLHELESLLVKAIKVQ